MSEMETTVPQESQQAEVAAAIVEASTTTPTEQAPQAQEPRKLKVKYLHEDKEVTEDEAVPLIQKGMDYDRVKAQSEALMEDRKYIEDLAKEYGMDPKTLKTELAKAAKATKMQELTAKGIPDDVAEEIIESRKFREEQKARETQVQATERQNREAAEFLREYPDVKATDIPQNVWNDVNNGIPLVHAYARHENSLLKAQMNKASAAAAVQSKSAENASAAPGAIGGSAPSPDYYSPERVEMMSDRQIADNWTKIQASMKNWK
jgi:hypothetical protein